MFLLELELRAAFRMASAWGSYRRRTHASNFCRLNMVAGSPARATTWMPNCRKQSCMNALHAGSIWMLAVRATTLPGALLVAGDELMNWEDLSLACRKFTFRGRRSYAVSPQLFCVVQRAIGRRHHLVPGNAMRRIVSD